jgi:hypothetical protein
MGVRSALRGILRKSASSSSRSQGAAADAAWPHEDLLGAALKAPDANWLQAYYRRRIARALPR